ncbi:hypothetical protein [Ramlibacter sp. PS4R-6]|uniref:hypothetical protein n=1 Tax=Ramlibacter sp. PS4R-6 TaxID=3133438 RepID=UPI0030A9FF2B
MAGRIVYVYGSANAIAGGIKGAFQHVELIAHAGLDAVIATPDGAAPTWFATRAKQVLHSDIRDDDLLVLPENFRPLLETWAARPNRKFVFCQSPWYVHEGLGTRASYADYGVEQVLCTSHSVMLYCRERFPGLPVAYTPPMIDVALFAPRAKKMQVAVIPRKRPVEAGVIADLLRHRYPKLSSSVTWVVIQNATEAQVAQAMGESAVFLSLARMEAHSLTTLEAMSSGAVVAGFCGVAGGDDTATPANGFWAAEEDVFGCVEQLARAIDLVMRGGMAYEALVGEARATAARYSREASGARLAAFWRDKLG